MCGIAGFINKKWSRGQLQQLNACLQHRGPDAEGIFYDEALGVGLGHRRLSILDLSSAANQPFYSKDRRYVMVYNGEVYNYGEIAAKYHIDTRTTSDTEVIIELFAKMGAAAIGELNGMFALVIFDTQTNRLFAFRDRIGIKPLYYYSDGEGFAFSSELKALFSLPVKKEINRNSVSDFLYLGYIPGTATIYEQFFKLLPGHYAIIENGIVDVKAYWKLEDAIVPQVLSDEEQAFSTLKQLVISSVKYCMISDVPLGVFLSGGVDSSLVAAVAQRLSLQPVKTFSIGFKESKYNESGYAKQVAAHIGSDHHEFIVEQKDAIEIVEKITRIYDEPYADSSAIPTYLVSQLAKKEVTVALSGDGGDELFMGYGFYYWARRLNNPLIRTCRKPIAALLRMSGDNRKKRASYMFDYPSNARRKSHIFSQEQYYFTEREITSLLRQPRALSLNEELEYHQRSLSVTEEQSFFDIKNYLPEELLVKTDRASMQHGLEIRVPLLDHRIVEFAAGLSEQLKLKEDTGKYLLKKVLYDFVPKEIFNRPKWGFAIPLQSWLSRDLSYLIDTCLANQVLEECGLVNPEQVSQLKKRFRSGEAYLYNRLWVLIILHKWFKEQRI